MFIDPAALRAAHHELRERSPGLRARDLAAALGAPEAALLAARCGLDGPTRVVRLSPSFERILGAMPSLGPVKAICRNETAVIEVCGAFGGVAFFGAMGQSVSDVDLRIFLRRWRHAFSVSEETRRGARRSLQFFDAHGAAIHKTYAVAETDLGALDRLTSEHRSVDQEPSVVFEPPEAPPPPRPDAEIDVVGLRQAWLAMTDTHEFFGLLRRFDVARAQALRLVGADLASPAPPATFERLLREAARRELPFMTFVGNPGVIQIFSGAIRRVVPGDGWLNVLDERFNLHARPDRIAGGWIVRKPTADGVVTAVEFYDQAGEQVALFNGKRKPGQPEMPAWRALAEGLA